MKKVFIFTIGMVIFLSACTDKRQEALDQLSVAEAKVQEMAPLGLDSLTAYTAIDAYENFISQFPEDSMSNEHRMKCAEIYSAVGNNEKCIILLNDIISSDDSSELVPKVMLFKAYLYDVAFKDIKKSEEHYRALMKRFPDHPLAKEAELCINVLGMSDEDLMRMFEEKNAIADSLATQE